MQRFLFLLMFGLACLSPFAGAAAAEDPFTVSNVPVDATAASASVAQNIAVADGRVRAWTTLYRRLTKSQDWGKQPALDALALQRLVRDYIVTDERRSTTRYVANVTYAFNADAVRRLLRSQDIPYVDVEARPILVVAMAPGYSPRSGWAQLWNNPKFANGEVPLLPPVDDTVDTQALGGLNFATAQWQEVESAASRIHATEAFLVQASAGRGNIRVALRRLGTGISVPVPDVVVQVRPGDSAIQAYSAAADATAQAIIEAWKARSAVDFGKHSKLIAEVRVPSLADWGMLVQRLSAIPTVSDVEVLAMDIGEARIAVTYAGTPDQLVALAAQSAIDLSNNGGTWQFAVEPTMAGPTPASQ